MENEQSIAGRSVRRGHHWQGSKVEEVVITRVRPGHQVLLRQEHLVLVRHTSHILDRRVVQVSDNVINILAFFILKKK